MSYFRKIDVRIWNDAKFRALSHYGKLVFIMLLTHPGMTALGAMRATPEGLGAELKMEPKAFREAFEEVLRQGLAEYDEEASCVFVPNFVRYQAAESPNVIKAWAKQLEWIPEGPLKARAVAGVQAFVEGYGEAFNKAFRESFGKTSTNQKAESSKQKDGEPHFAQSALPPAPSAGSPESGRVLNRDGVEPDADKLASLLATPSPAKPAKRINSGVSRFKERFDEFWNTFAYKHSKTRAMKAWMALAGSAKPGDDLEALADSIMRAAAIEAKRRPTLLATGRTPIYPEGWLSQRRFEDEGLLSWGVWSPDEQAFVDVFNANIGDLCPQVADWTEKRSELTKVAVAGKMNLDQWGEFWRFVRDGCEFRFPISYEWFLVRENFKAVAGGQYGKEGKAA